MTSMIRPAADWPRSRRIRRLPTDYEVLPTLCDHARLAPEGSKNTARLPPRPKAPSSAGSLLVCHWWVASDNQGMDATAWVALAGIAGTLFGTLSSPLLAERMRRESVRREALLNQRLSMYADLLRVTARVADNAM